MPATRHTRHLGSRTLGSLPADDRVRLGAAGLRTFFALADRWGLGAEDQRALLGGVGRSTLRAWRQCQPAAPGAYSTDLLMRLSYLLGIYAALQRLYGASPAFADAWPGAPNAGPPFRGHSPAAYLREGGVPALRRVRGLLEARADGDLPPPPLP